ncbi:thermonuclease family protein [Ottowia thiooxydans]|uniref:thermonuclease family protein n=1 Tax=Ottowia thiooxydans TaxID=219182 RepID=UPI00042029EC|nr:thermonuclease family protein [Ottowia thiooxydans]
MSSFVSLFTFVASTARRPDLFRCLSALVLGGSAVVASAQEGARPRAGQSWVAEVTYVVDGDSIWVRSEADGRRRKLRLEGVDAPEICQTHGPEARAAMQALVQGERMRITVRAYDRFGRGIASVRRASDELDIAGAMVAQGWAWTNTYKSRRGKYWREEALAREQGKGLFNDSSAISPTDFRLKHGPCGAKAYSQL